MARPVRLVLSSPAARQLEDITASLAQDNPSSAEDAYVAIVGAARGLTTSTAQGQAGRIHETRELAVGATPYVIVFRANASEVTILAVFHRARDFAKPVGAPEA